MTDIADTDLRLDIEQAEKYLITLYPQGFGDGWGVVYDLDNYRHYQGQRIDDVLAQLTSDLARSNLYFNVGVQAKKLEGKKRGGNDTVIAIPGFYADIDIAGPGHKDENLPPSRGRAMEIIRSFPLDPTMIVNTGGGLHAYWCTDRPIEVNDSNRAGVKGLLRRFKDTLQGVTSYRIDDTKDLARTLRLPGSYNHKGEPKLVKIIEAHPDRRYSLSDIVEHLAPEQRNDPHFKTPRITVVGQSNDGRPGDDFNERKSFPELLEEHGWYLTGVSGSVETWARPNANTGKSATYNYDGSGKLFIFSSSVPGLEPGRFYDQFQFYAYTVHDGDFVEAAKQLRREGYGRSSSFTEEDDGTLVPSVEESHVPILKGDEVTGYKYSAEMCAQTLVGLYNVHTVKQASGSFYIYQDGRYTFDAGNYHLHRAITHAIAAGGTGFTTAKINNTFGALRGHAPTIDPGEKPSTEYLNVNNGLLHWQTGELQPHTPEVMSTTRIPVTWRPDATCPAIDAYFERTLQDSELIQFAWEVIAYCLWPTNHLDKAIMVYGQGGTGKSGYIGLIEALVGPENTAHVPLAKVGERFYTHLLLGKLVNSGFDISTEPIRETGAFKSVVSGEPVMVESKGKDGFAARLYSTMVFAANEIPASSDSTSGWRRRWHVVPFTQRWREGDPGFNSRYKQEITTRRELEGALVKAVEALRRLDAYQSWEAPKAVREATSEMFDEQIPVRRFAREVLTYKKGAELAKEDVYALYLEWYGRNSAHGAKSERRVRPDLHEFMEETEPYKQVEIGHQKYINLSVSDKWHHTLMTLRSRRM